MLARNVSGNQCILCPHRCVIDDVGRCGVYKNIEGEIVSLSYGEIECLALEPLTKKPLYHFQVGKNVLSLGSWGCNLKCDACQNYALSRAHCSLKPTHLTPYEVVQETLELSEQGCIGLAYTYNEPTVNYEYIYDTMSLAGSMGLANVLITNGLINPSPLVELLPYLDAVNVDIKAFGDDFYVKSCQGLKGMSGVARGTVELLYSEGVHVEVSHLVLPGENSSEQEFDELVEWLVNLERDIPLHLPLYRPSLNSETPAMSADDLEKLATRARSNLSYVYTSREPNTYCKSCGSELVTRQGLRVVNESSNHEEGCPLSE